MSKSVFGDMFNRWQRAAGVKPADGTLTVTAAALATINKRPGTMMHLAAAMYARAEGATQPEVVQGTGDTHYDAVRALKAAGWQVVKGGARGGHAVYTATPPAPVKPAAKRPRKGKGKGAEVTAGDGDAT